MNESGVPYKKRSKRPSDETGVPQSNIPEPRPEIPVPKVPNSKKIPKKTPIPGEPAPDDEK